MTPQRLVAVFYLAVIVLQLTWHGALPQPGGNRNWTLALLAALPLILPLQGILSGRLSSMTWGGYLLVIYFTFGVMEVWSNPAQRWPALIQVALVVLYVSSLVWLARRKRPAS
ncbi:MAG: DUF2069 domain-containing protein [Lysobacterales bacterium]